MHKLQPAAAAFDATSALLSLGLTPPEGSDLNNRAVPGRQTATGSALALWSSRHRAPQHAFPGLS